LKKGGDEDPLPPSFYSPFPQGGSSLGLSKAGFPLILIGSPHLFSRRLRNSLRSDILGILTDSLVKRIGEPESAKVAAPLTSAASAFPRKNPAKGGCGGGVRMAVAASLISVDSTFTGKYSLF
jgi:hypothetical protein